MNEQCMTSGFKTGAAFVVLLAVFFAAGCASESRQAPGRPGCCPAVDRGSKAGVAMDRSKLLVGAYFLTENLYDDRHVKEVADAGIDFLVAVSAKKEVLDLCAKHKLGVITGSIIPGWWGDDGKRAGLYHETLPLEKLDGIKPRYPHHPALWGDYLVDEPNAKDFGHINSVIQRYHELFPGQLAFLNLYPNYANTAPAGVSPEMQKAPSQLGTATYTEHVAKYVELVGTDYICFDHYPFASGSDYLENLDIVGTACRDSRRDLWVIMQSGAWKANAVLDEYQIRWQVYLCLAYGANIIMHASYSTQWWDETTSCVNKAGEKNVTYGYVQNVNAELHALSAVFMRYDNIGVYPCGNVSGADARMAKQLEAQTARNRARGDSAGRKLLTGVEADGALIAGCFKRKDGGGYAVMLVNSQNPWGAAAAVNVSLKWKGTAYIKGKKTRLGKGLKLESGEGVFITVAKGDGE